MNTKLLLTMKHLAAPNKLTGTISPVTISTVVKVKKLATSTKLAGPPSS